MFQNMDINILEENVKKSIWNFARNVTKISLKDVYKSINIK